MQRLSQKKCTAPLRSEEKICQKVVELLSALGYDGVTIQAADSTEFADEKVLGFAPGEKLRSKSSSHRAPQKKSKKDRSSAPVNPKGDRANNLCCSFPGLASKPTALSPVLAAAPKSRRRKTPENLQQQWGAEIAIVAQPTTELDRLKTFDNL